MLGNNPKLRNNGSLADDFRGLFATNTLLIIEMLSLNLIKVTLLISKQTLESWVSRIS